jgi:hypothetical protein
MLVEGSFELVFDHFRVGTVYILANIQNIWLSYDMLHRIVSEIKRAFKGVYYFHEHGKDPPDDEGSNHL